MADDDTPSCNRCGDVYELRPGCEPTPECDSCAHAVLQQLRDLVTHPHEDKGSFINRVNAVLNPE